jgi:hypothetical protein
MSCYLEEFVSHVAAMLNAGAPQQDIDRFLETLVPEYRAEVLAAALELAQSREDQ